jgi:hypothetical protein
VNEPSGFAKIWVVPDRRSATSTRPPQSRAVSAAESLSGRSATQDGFLAGGAAWTAAGAVAATTTPAPATASSVAAPAVTRHRPPDIVEILLLIADKAE